MLIRSGDVSLRAFEPGLDDVVLALRNHATVREHMRDPAPIARESHYRWVKENVVDARNVHLFVAYDGEEAVGITLLRNFKGTTAEIGVMIVDAATRPRVCYVAAHLVACYGFERLGLTDLLSYVPLHNEHALAFNLHCGFEPSGTKDDVYHELVFTSERYRTHPTHLRFREKHRIEVLD